MSSVLGDACRKGVFSVLFGFSTSRRLNGRVELGGLCDYSKGSNRRRSIEIYCKNCNSHLYKYSKGGKGMLVKCLEERIIKDSTKGDLCCATCSTQFARLIRIKGKPAHKIIGGKVYWSR